MSKGFPNEVRRLCRRLKPLLRKRTARQEFGEVCGIRHRQQLHHCFPLKGVPPAEMRLTADVALRANRWLEENRRHDCCYFIPSWEDLKLMGKYLIQPRNYVAVIADRVGGGIGNDQVYSYFSTGRRQPDGEFVLRLLNFIALLRGISLHPVLATHLRTMPYWPSIETALSIQMKCGGVRAREVRRQMLLPVKRPTLRHGQTAVSVLRFKGKKTSLLGVLLGVGPKIDLSKVASLWESKR